MMKILYYELRKEFIQRNFFILLIALMFVNCLWMEWDYRTNGGFTDDFVRINASDKEISYYNELHSQLDGNLNADKVSYVVTEYNKYRGLISGNYSTEYDETMHTGYVFGDYSLLTTVFYNPIRYLVSYKEQNELLLDKARENVSFYEEQGNTYQIEKNQYILQHYSNRNPVYFSETSGWKHLFSYDKSDLFILVLLILGIVPSFVNEREKGMDAIQITTSHGSKSYVTTKLLAHSCMAIILVLVFGIINFISIHRQYGLGGSQMMLYSISDYVHTPISMSVQSFYALIIISKCIGIVVITVMMTFFARIIKNSYTIFLTIIGSSYLLLYFSGFLGGITTVEKALAILSPFSLLKVGDVMMTLKEIRIFGHFVPLHTGIVVSQVALLLLVLLLFRLIERRGRVLR